MGKKDSFNVGELVFAKVKGYPAWPAKIVDITKSKKYSVYFYGTGESANVNGKDISLYVKTKAKFATSSSLKKAGFKAAIDQIEAALHGEDSAPNSYEIPLDKSNATFDNTLNSTLETTEIGSNSIKAEETTIDDDNDDAEDEFEAETTTTVNDNDNDNDNVTESEEMNNSVKMEKHENVAVAAAAAAATTTTTTADDDDDDADFNAAASEPTTSEPDTQSASPIIEKDKALIEKANEKSVERIEKAEAVSTTVGDNINVDMKAEDKKQSRSGRIIKKTKYLLEEFDESPQIPGRRKRHSELQTTPVAAKIAKKQSDDSSVAADSNDAEVKRVSQVIMNEVNLLQYDVDIKSSLQLTSADTARCIAVLEKYKALEVTALMLKKNPQVAETIKRLRRYVGNTKEWDFSEEQSAEFNEKAAKIRKLAEIIYRNFKKLFSFPSHVSFWQGFTDEVQSFKEQTKSMSHEELITLTEDVQSTVNQPIEVKNSIRV